MKLRHNLREKLVEEFARTIASVSSLEEMRLLFDDLFTKTEITMFMRRIHAANLLFAGESYESIRNSLKMSDNTIKFIASKIHTQGEGYAKACEYLAIILPEIHDEISEATAILEDAGFARIKDRYSSYYLAEKLVKEVPKYLRTKNASLKRKNSLKK